MSTKDGVAAQKRKAEEEVVCVTCGYVCDPERIHEIPGYFLDDNLPEVFAKVNKPSEVPICHVCFDTRFNDRTCCLCSRHFESWTQSATSVPTLEPELFMKAMAPRGIKVKVNAEDVLFYCKECANDYFPKSNGGFFKVPQRKRPKFSDEKK